MPKNDGLTYEERFWTLVNKRSGLFAVRALRTEAANLSDMPHPASRRVEIPQQGKQTAGCATKRKKGWVAISRVIKK
jgi:hypothetical protein